MTRKRTRLWLPALLLALFVLWTIGVKTIDVAAIGPEGSSVGFSTLNAAVRDEGTTLHYVPAEYPAVADRHVVDALARAAQAQHLNFLEGISQSKDSFFGQHEPDNMPVSKRLHERWEAWEKGHVLCSEMEAAALFVISSIRGCRAAAIMDFKDMGKTVGVACDAVRILAREDGEIKD